MWGAIVDLRPGRRDGQVDQDDRDREGTKEQTAS
jgi:hypothetical protein